MRAKQESMLSYSNRRTTTTTGVENRLSCKRLIEMEEINEIEKGISVPLSHAYRNNSSD